MHLPLPTSFAAAIVTFAALATPTPTASAMPETATEVAIPGTGYKLAVDTTTTTHQHPDGGLLDAVATWLGKEFDLPPAPAHPDFEFVSDQELATMWLSGIESDELAGNQGRDSLPEIVALYDTHEHTIFLANTWSMTSPVDVSVLVHEMVHHLQTAAGTKFACPQKREELAYAAQDRWLSLFGTSLDKEFEVDDFTLLLRTECLSY